MEWENLLDPICVTAYAVGRFQVLTPLLLKFPSSGMLASIPASKQPQNQYDIPDAVCTALDSWWWTERPSKTCRLLFQNKINLRYCASAWFYCRGTHVFFLTISWHIFVTLSIPCGPGCCWKFKSLGMLHCSGIPGGGVQTPPKFRSFDRVEPDCKLSGKCLVFLFQHPN